MHKTTRICLIGAGRAGQVHANSLATAVKNADLTAIVDRDDAARDAIATHCDAPAFRSLEEAVDGADFDAVVITTPTFTHRQLTVLAAEHGKHVFCEKPMALSLSDCDEIMEAVRR